MDITNIGNVDDEFHRYKMPVIVGKVEGNGNGIKTRIVNCSKVAKALHRDPKQVCKFFGYELGSQTIINDEDDVFIVNGKHDNNVLVELLQKYIEMFVLCENCKLPETELKIGKSGNIKQACAACGHSAPVDNTHKLCNFIINSSKNSKNKEKLDKKSRRAKKQSEALEKEKEKEKNKSKKNETEEERAERKAKKKAAALAAAAETGATETVAGDEVTGMGELNIDDAFLEATEREPEDEEWSADTSKEAIAARLAEAEAAAKLLEGRHEKPKPSAVESNGFADNQMDPVDELKEFSKKEKKPALRKAKVEELFPLDIKAQVEAIIECFLDFDSLRDGAKGISGVMAELIPTLKEMNIQGNKLAEMAACDYMDELGSDQTVEHAIPLILKCFYDNDIVEEDNIIEWFNNECEDEEGEIARKAAKPFVTWLQNAEEESESD